MNGRDPILNKMLIQEWERQKTVKNFIASENYASDAVMYFCGSEFSNKYAEGYPGKRYYNGCMHYDEMEKHGIELVTKLYGCNFANIQPHSGANANLAIFKAFLSPGWRILGMDLSAGGHLSHGSPANLSGNWFDNHFYGVDSDGWIDYEALAHQARELMPKMIIAGASAYPRQIDFKRFREIADSCGAYLLVDMAHYSGLIAGGIYENPLPYADFVTSTTHKTLRGARGGMILWNDDRFTKKINSAVFPGTQGGPLMNQVAGKTQAFYEALQPGFKKYAKDVVEVSRFMCDELIKLKIKVITGGTDSHIILIDTDEHSGRWVADELEKKHGVVVNKNSIPNDRRGVWDTSGIRMGTAAMVTRHGNNPDLFRSVVFDVNSVIKSIK